jgi:phosphoenolpyruvate-protein kinase (PTS system EI component)
VRLRQRNPWFLRWAEPTTSIDALAEAIQSDVAAMLERVRSVEGREATAQKEVERLRDQLKATQAELAVAKQWLEEKTRAEEERKMWEKEREKLFDGRLKEAALEVLREAKAEEGVLGCTWKVIGSDETPMADETLSGEFRLLSDY